jgi:opacity protein-like surface antigen
MWRALVSVSVLFGLTASAPAADLDPYDVEPSNSSPSEVLDLAAFEARWEGSVSIYAWMLGMNGETGLDGLPPISFDITFDEFLEHLDAVFMAFGELRRGRFGIATDFFYADVSDGLMGPIGLASADLSVKLTIATAMAEYRVWEVEKSSVDVMAGARFWRVKSAADFSVGSGVFERDPEDLESWVDPMIGVKTRLQGHSPVYFSGWAMIGGFGAAAEIDWDVFGGVGYQFRKNLSVLAGYRAIGVDYDRGDFLFNATLHGPIVGMVADF